ncbi:MAG: hemolysin family protein [Bacteroidales bacterium]|jgi:CBS domain containing-hemolysin-like protein|nr:hemolysin family protein [Bacteroidales bacterium]
MGTIVVIFVAILFSAFFSGMEIAFVSANRLRVELDKKQGAFGGRLAALFVQNPGQFISTMLVGNNIALVIFGLVFSRLLAPVLSVLTDSDAAIMVIQTILSTLIMLLVAEFLPKNIFILSPNLFLRTLSVPAVFFYYVFYPVSKLSLWLSNIFIRLFTGRKWSNGKNENVVFSRTELNHFVNIMGEPDDPDNTETRDIRIFRNALEFPNVKLRECMIPRTEIVAIDAGSPVSELRQKFIETGYSKIPVYENSIDNIIGYFELKDLYRNPPDIRSSLRKLAIVPETMAANKLLRIFVEDKRNVALVVDEFGGTSGMVTIEDVLEEIVGDIEDEHDTSDFTEKSLGNGEYLFSGRLDIDYLNERYDLNLPERDDYETLAGLVLYHHGSIPKPNDLIRVGSVVIKVIKVTSTRLELVSLKTEA